MPSWPVLQFYPESGIKSNVFYDDGTSGTAAHVTKQLPNTTQDVKKYLSQKISCHNYYIKEGTLLNVYDFRSVWSFLNPVKELILHQAVLMVMYLKESLGHFEGPRIFFFMTFGSSNSKTRISTLING